MEDGDRGASLRGVVHDITERYAAEQALRQSEEHHRNTVELSPHMPWTADADGRILTVSSRWTRYTGLPVAAALGEAWLEQAHPDDLSQTVASVTASLATGSPLDAQVRLRAADGSYRWMRVRAVPKHAPDGAVLRWYGLTEDVHDQVLALARLAESEANFRSIIELSPQIPWIADAAGNILDVGPRWEELIGLSREASLGSGWAVAIHPDDSDRVQAAWASAVATHGPLDLRYRLRQRDGTFKWFRARAGVRCYRAGDPRWYGLLENIHAQVVSENALREGYEWLLTAHEAAGIGLFEVDLADHSARLSPQSLVMLGLPADGAAILSGATGWASRVHPEDAERGWTAMQAAVASGSLYDFSFRVPTETGGLRWINGIGRAEYDCDGIATRVLGINIDLTERKAAEQALHDSETLSRSIVNASRDSIKLLDLDGRVLFANDASRIAMELSSRDDAVGRLWADLWPDAARLAAQDAFLLAREGGVGRFSAARPTVRGTPKWWDVVISPVPGEAGRPHRLVTIARDISQQKLAEDQVRWTAAHDSLTGLPNRALFHERLTDAIAHAEATSTQFALLAFDIDSFKQINDTLGHGAGDELLKTFATRIRAEIRSGDTIARLGGDEFAVILPNIDAGQELDALVTSLLSRLREPFERGGLTLDCRASAGASLYPSHGTSPDDLLKHADIALYAAKANGRGSCTIFQPFMRADMQRRFSGLNLARDAIKDDRIVPFYQPKVELGSGRIIGFEALLRWRDIHGQINLPGAIAAAFDDFTTAAGLRERMFAAVLHHVGTWRDDNIEFGHVAVNAAPADFQRNDFAERIIFLLGKARIPAACIQIEVTESVFLGRGADYVKRALHLLSAEGVRIALDDFGTGFASLTHLKTLPIDVIKIDREFVTNVAESREDRAIVRAVIDLARSLGKDVVAEGIETQAQADCLRDLDCRVGQGFLFSPAIASSVVPAMLGPSRHGA